MTEIICECGHSLDKHCITCGCDGMAAEGYCGCQRSPQMVVDAFVARLTAERDAAIEEAQRLRAAFQELYDDVCASGEYGPSASTIRASRAALAL